MVLIRKCIQVHLFMKVWQVVASGEIMSESFLHQSLTLRCLAL